MKKTKRKRTAAEKRARRERKIKYMTITIFGKQKHVLRPPQIDGMDADEFIRENADPLWLHQNEMWENFSRELALLLGSSPHAGEYQACG